MADAAALKEQTAADAVPAHKTYANVRTRIKERGKPFSFTALKAICGFIDILTPEAEKGLAGY